MFRKKVCLQMKQECKRYPWKLYHTAADVIEGALGTQAAMAAKASSEASAAFPVAPSPHLAQNANVGNEPAAISRSGCSWTIALATVFAVHMACALLGLVLWTAHSRATVSNPPWSAWMTAVSALWGGGPHLTAATVCGAAAVAWWLLISPKQRQTGDLLNGQTVRQTQQQQQGHHQQRQHDDADENRQLADAVRQPADESRQLAGAARQPTDTVRQLADSDVTGISRSQQDRPVSSAPLSDGSQTAAESNTSGWRLWRKGQAALEYTGWQRIKACTCLSVILQVC